MLAAVCARASKVSLLSFYVRANARITRGSRRTLLSPDLQLILARALAAVAEQDVGDARDRISRLTARTRALGGFARGASGHEVAGESRHRARRARSSDVMCDAWCDVEMREEQRAPRA